MNLRNRRCRLPWLRGGMAFVLVCILQAAPLSAQQPAPGWQPRSGDAATDARLADINLYAARYRAAFRDELVRYYAAPADLVDTLLQDPLWTAGDIYYACALAQVLGRPCRYVAEQWRRDRADGWAGIARKLGITPGSEQARRLGQAFIATYRRWARPLPSAATPQ